MKMAFDSLGRGRSLVTDFRRSKKLMMLFSVFSVAFCVLCLFLVGGRVFRNLLIPRVSAKQISRLD